VDGPSASADAASGFDEVAMNTSFHFRNTGRASRLRAARLLPWSAAALLAALGAAAHANTRADPLDARAAVPDTCHRSALAAPARGADAPASSWREANETVNTVGGWRAYAREAAGGGATASGAHAGHGDATAAAATSPSHGGDSGADGRSAEPRHSGHHAAHHAEHHARMHPDGMKHDGMKHEGMNHGAMNHGAMNHGAMKHEGMKHGGMGHSGGNGGHGAHANASPAAGAAAAPHRHADSMPCAPDGATASPSNAAPAPQAAPARPAAAGSAHDHSQPRR
jgi:pentapeptide MXKDX repeat protein